MSLTSFIMDYKWMLEIGYALIISLICMVIVTKTDKFFKLSAYQGIRYFRNAFFFYGIAFIGRYIFGVFSDMNWQSALLIQFLFEYFLITGGFFLLYSLIWKKIEVQKKEYLTSLLNSKVIIFHIMAIFLALLDILSKGYSFLFFSQIIIFSLASLIAYKNLKKNKKKEFPKFYLLATLIGFVAWVLNYLAASFFKWNPGILIDVGIMNILFFLLFLYGVLKVTKK